MCVCGEVARRVLQLKCGARVLSLRKLPFADGAFQMESQGRYAMSWGVAVAYVYVKL